MESLRIQSEQLIGEPVVACATFVTPGFSLYGDFSLRSILTLLKDEPSRHDLPDDGFNGYEGFVLISTTESFVVIFAVNPGGLFSVNYVIDREVARTQRTSSVKISFTSPQRTNVEVVFSEDQIFRLTTQDSPENVAALMQAVLVSDNC